jgi:ribosomal protein S18 acetylase RimI-like enzyme
MAEGARMHIRVFERADADAVVDLWRRCGLTRPWNDPYRDIDRKLAVQPELFLVGALDGRIIASAMAGYDGHRGAVYYLAVDPTYRDRGYGRSVMQAVAERLVALGCPKINLMIRGDNADALEFYRHIAYEPQDVTVYGLRLIADTPAEP